MSVRNLTARCVCFPFALRFIGVCSILSLLVSRCLHFRSDTQPIGHSNSLSFKHALLHPTTVRRGSALRQLTECLGEIVNIWTQVKKKQIKHNAEPRANTKHFHFVIVKLQKLSDRRTEWDSHMLGLREKRCLTELHRGQSKKPMEP